MNLFYKQNVDSISITCCQVIKYQNYFHLSLLETFLENHSFYILKID